MASQILLQYLESEILKCDREIRTHIAEIQETKHKYEKRKQNQNGSSGYITIESPRIYREPLCAEHDSLNTALCDALPVRIHSNTGIAEHDSLNLDYPDTPPVCVHLNLVKAENDSLNSTRYDAQLVRTYSNSNISKHTSSNNDLSSNTWRSSTPRHVQFNKSDALENSPKVPPFTTPQQGTSHGANETLD
jgi:hypothetical protein